MGRRQDRYILIHKVPNFLFSGAISQVDYMFLFGASLTKYLEVFWINMHQLNTRLCIVCIILQCISLWAPETAGEHQDRVWAPGNFFFSSFGNLASAAVIRALICLFDVAQPWKFFFFSCNHATVKIFDWVDEIKLLSPHISCRMFYAASILFLSSSEQSSPETWDIFLPLTGGLNRNSSGQEFEEGGIYFQLYVFSPQCCLFCLYHFFSSFKGKSPVL